MEKKLQKESLSKFVLVLGVLGIISYFLHVILGTLNYPGYDSLSQAVSDLTSEELPSKEIARLYSTFYGLFSSLVSVILIYLYKNEKIISLKVGMYLISIMYLVSAIGYALFPLSDNSFQNLMHIVVTILVVLLTVISLIMLMIAFKKIKAKNYFYLTLLSFFGLMGGAISLNVVSPNLFGIAERFSVFTFVIYLGIICYFNYTYKKAGKLSTYPHVYTER